MSTGVRNPIYDGLSGQRAEALEGIISLTISGELGLEEQTSENVLVEQLDLSRTPIREALGILAFGGIVTQKPQVGVWVNRFSTDQIKDTLRVSKEVEAMALVELAGAQEDNSGLLRALSAASSIVFGPHSYRRDYIADEVLRADAEVHSTFVRDSSLKHFSGVVALAGIKRRIYHIDNPLNRNQGHDVQSSDLDLIAGLTQTAWQPDGIPTVLSSYYAQQVDLLEATYTGQKS
jgi:DNA-binding GntR family transcriptional regulator